jgi:hypothetical protein
LRDARHRTFAMVKLDFSFLWTSNNRAQRTTSSRRVEAESPRAR